MFLIELKQTGILELLHQINDAFNTNDVLQKETAARYLSFLMTYRDFDFHFKDKEYNPMLPIEYFLRPGVETSIAALEQFAKAVSDDKSIDKRVLRYTQRFMDEQNGKQQFHYQLTKLQDYFKRRFEETQNETK